MKSATATSSERTTRPGDSLLVLLAHNDDEFFVSPLLHREIASGTQVWVAYLTHGSIYGADSGARVSESRAVLQGLGLPPEQVLSIGITADIFDGRLASHVEGAYKAMLAALAGIPIDRLWTLAWEGGHPDHDAANLIGAALARTLGCEAFEFPAYNAHRLPAGLFRVMAFPRSSRDTPVIPIGVREGIDAMRRALRYRSQRRTFLGLAPGAMLEFLWHRRQHLRPIPSDRDYRRPPHEGLLYYERRFGTTFRDFHAQVQPFLAGRVATIARSSAADYRIEALGTGEEEIRITAGLLRQVWPHSPQFSIEYLRWLYADNPVGPAVGANAWHGDELVGHYAVVPIEVQLRDRRVRGALSLNTAVHAAHQGRGLFVQLAEATYRSAKAGGIHHVVGVANANSTPGFLGRLGFQHLGALEAKLIWGPIRWPVVAQESRDWRRFWTPESYRWRIANPAASYQVASSGEHLLCLAPTGEFGIQAILRMERDASFGELLRSQLPVARTGPLKLWIGLDPELRLSPLTACKVPKALRRSPLNLIYRSLSDDASAPAPDRVEFSLLDFDAY
jgi:LmbE family N-acetylglucosaminyl deacetylase/predicted N-acetyltransferase YhbS